MVVGNEALNLRAMSIMFSNPSRSFMHGRILTHPCPATVVLYTMGYFASCGFPRWPELHSDSGKSSADG